VVTSSASTTSNACIPAWGTIPRSSSNAWPMPSEVSTKSDEDQQQYAAARCQLLEDATLDGPVGARVEQIGRHLLVEHEPDLLGAGLEYRKAHHRHDGEGLITPTGAAHSCYFYEQPL